MRIIPLHVHSCWSLLDGVASVDELVQAAQAQGLPALALTDTNALYGAVEFAARCRAAGIRPLVGTELSLARGRQVVLLACSSAGYANLCRLVTLVQSAHGRRSPAVRVADLAAHAEGVICLYAYDPEPVLPEYHDPAAASMRRAGRDGDAFDSLDVRPLAEAFGRERLFVMLQQVEAGDAARAAALAARAAEHGLPAVAAHPVHYLSPADAPLHAVLAAMRAGRRLDGTTRRPDLSLPTEDDMRRRFAAFPEALENTARVADQCRFEFPLGRLHFPALDLPPERTAREELWARACAGAEARYGALTPAVEARLCKEVDVIATLGYTSYFFVVADIVRFAREQGVPVSPRGSASSSVAAYCLGIHDVDPLAHDLYFERFLSLERRDPPDIDLDLCSHRRDEVIHYVYQRYGADHVAMVCTYATLRPRSALREAAKVYGLPEERIKELSAHLPGFWHPGMRRSTEEALAELHRQARDEVEREVLDTSMALLGRPHHLSIHPGGIVISPGPITDLVPLQHATKGIMITQYDLSGIEQLGLVKIDLLGISALTVVADCVALIRRRVPGFALEAIPPADGPTAQTLAAGRTIGCFQIESPGMRLTLRELTARTVNDLIVALALYRPGPLKGGLKDAFVRRHLGQEPAGYLHPALEPLLRETHGVILYQEQVLRIAHEVGGFSLGEADQLRRAMSKHRSAHEMAQLHDQFVAGAAVTSGLAPAVAEQVWDLMAAFAGYGFPKAHSAGYAALAYRMAYLKTHYPAEFMAARLAVHGGFYWPPVYLGEARRLGLDVRPPHVNHGAEAFALEDGVLWMGLGQVRDLTHATIKAILAGRPFASFEDFLTRARPAHVEAVNLAKAGAFAGLGEREALLARLARERWHGRHDAQLELGLFAAVGPGDEHLAPCDDVARCAEYEHAVLGMLVSVHPLKLVAAELADSPRSRSDALAAQAGREVTLAGVRIAAHRLHSQGQEPRVLVDMEDEAGAYQVLWDAVHAERYRTLLARRGPVLVRGKVSHDRQGLPVVIGHEIVKIAGE